ncbi:MAG: hypothetical protein ABJH82_00035 [Polaribacter sp.]|uniref:hypothetical protein n=1 Tax=Polaribacter sp. TaxID=1920175 RepID=UPI0032674C78
MKSNNFRILIFLSIIFSLSSCLKKEASKLQIAPKYVLSITQTDNTNAPSLQSFAHGLNNDEWLLFAGRTNSLDSLNGGIHRLNGNYSGSSFTQVSYNNDLIVYNQKSDLILGSLSIENFIKKIEDKCLSFSKKTPGILCPYYNLLKVVKNNTSIFKNSNALVKQEGNYLYVIGGYGPADFTDPSKGYITYNQIAKINVPNFIKLIKGSTLTKEEWLDLISLGKNEKLISTGGELYILDNIFYLTAGHNFGNNAPGFQKYVDAVYPFTLKNNSNNHNILDITVNSPISDVPSPTANGTDAISIFRRRDGPITPNLYKSKNTIKPGLTLYTGVFRPDSTVIKDKDTINYHLAWNNAIYVHPNKEVNSKKYTYDRTYNQKNYNVYSCPNIVLFDSKSETLHTFLLGGIGDGKRASVGHLSGFTNTGVHIKMNIGDDVLKSTHNVLDYNIFNNNTENNPPFFGAEAILFPNKSLTFSEFSKEIIDLKLSFEGKNSIEVGYVFGGIEAFQSNPGTYGIGKSRASNKIWKVTLTKQITE